MKFMKLGSKPDAFQADGNFTRYVSTDLPTDVVVNVGEVKFNLHKFPLLSKSNYLQKLILNSNVANTEEIHLVDFPGGPDAFEICAKFCYGMIFTLNAYNVVAARCAAEYLKMTEDIETGNLIFKIEVFLNSSIFRSWKDSIIVLQTTKSLLPWSEDLKVVGRCIDSIASKTSVDPSNVNWSYTYNRKLAALEQIIGSGARFPQKIPSVPVDWWVEDICELEIDLYRRVMVAVKSKGRMSNNLIGEALEAYAIRWLPESVEALISDTKTEHNKAIVETMIWLLPSHMDAVCCCSFLLKLLKVAILVEVGDEPKEELVSRISSQLDKASLKDLLIPARSPDTTIYDFGLVQTLVNKFTMKHSQDSVYNKKIDKGKDNLVLGRGVWIDVGKLIDQYLSEIAGDPNLPLSSFIDLSQSIPESARPIHDGLYKGIDIYLKEHPTLTKSEKKKICGLMDVKKLTMEASMHAAQNERLPLRVVVQVLYFEQLKVGGGTFNVPHSMSRDSSRSTAHTENWERTVVHDDHMSLDKRMRSMRVSSEHGKDEKRNKNNKISGGGGMFLLPSRSRRFFERLWVGAGGGNKEHGDNGSSEMSGSSRSPSSMIPKETKSFGSSSTRHRRKSVS